MQTNNFTDNKQMVYNLREKQGKIHNTKSPLDGKFSRTGNVRFGQIVGRKLKPFAGEMSCGDLSLF